MLAKGRVRVRGLRHHERAEAMVLLFPRHRDEGVMLLTQAAHSCLPKSRSPGGALSDTSVMSSPSVETRQVSEGGTWGAHRRIDSKQRLHTTQDMPVGKSGGSSL